MIRVAPKTEAPPPETPTGEVPIPPEVLEMDAQLPPLEEAPMGGGGQVDQAIAVYRGPEMGPFACEHCQFFNDDGSCMIVSGQIDPGGLCNMFTRMEGEAEEVPMEEPEVPMEAPEVPPGV